MAKLPSWMEPQLATLTRERFFGPGWIFERKLDGEKFFAQACRTAGRAWSPSGLMPPTRADATGTG